MRFGVALDLWAKSELESQIDEPKPQLSDTDEDGQPIEAEVVEMEPADDWLENLRRDYRDGVIIEATDAVRRRAGGNVEITSIEQCRLAKSSESRRSIENELSELKASAESEPQPVTKAVPSGSAVQGSTESGWGWAASGPGSVDSSQAGSNPATSPGAKEPQTADTRAAVSPPDEELGGDPSAVPPRSSSWLRISDAVSHRKVTQDRVLYIAAAVLGADTPDGLSYYQIAEQSEEVLLEMVRRLKLDKAAAK